MRHRQSFAACLLLAWVTVTVPTAMPEPLAAQPADLAEGPHLRLDREAAAPACEPGSSPRLVIDNQCADPVWTLITAPGTPAQVAVAAQWKWAEPYFTHRYFADTGGLGSVSLDRPNLLQLGTAPNPAIVAGMVIRVARAGASGADLTSKVRKVNGSRIKLVKAASTAVSDAHIAYYTRQGALSLPAASSKTICVPDKGAPSGNFRFFMGCPGLGAADTDPFNPRGCVIGSIVGDRAGVNTLFEATFGCKSPLTGAACAFNPGDAAAQGYPDCPGDPTAANCGPLGATDFFDISAVDGYTLAMRVDAAGTCSAPSKDASMLDLASCPHEDADTLYSDDAARQTVIDGGISLLTASTTPTATYLQVCAAPYKWFETTSLGLPVNPTLATPSCANGACNAVSYYAGAACDPGACTPCPTSDPTCTPTDCTSCPGGSGPQQKVGPLGTGEKAIQNTNYVQGLRALGYRGYTWQFDDGIGAQTCTAGAVMKVTLCPSGGNPRPYQANTLWTFSAARGSCRTTGAKGAPDGVTTFGSLFACQTATMQYTCANLTAADPFGLPIGVWAADAAATRAPTARSRTYAAFTTTQRLVCQDFSVDTQGFPSAGAIIAPNCTYYWKAKEQKNIFKVCPG